MPAQGPPPGTPGEDEDPTRIFRFDISAEIAQPQGDIADRQDQAKAIRIGWFGANANKYFSVGGSFRFIATEPKQSVGVPDRTELFMDLVGIYLRVAIPVAPQFKLFVEADPSLVGMHTPCEDPTSTILCNDEGFEFSPRFGLIGRAGAIYEAVPGRLDLVAYGSYEKVFPDDGGWMSFGAGLTVHYGPTVAELRRRQQWQMQMQMQMQMQNNPQPQPQPGRRRMSPQPSSPPPPPPPPPPGD